MEPEFFLNTERLKSHAEELLQQKYTAQRLHQQILTAKRAADPSFAYRFDLLAAKAEGLAQFFSKLSQVMEDTSTDAELASIRARRLIEDSRLHPEEIFQTDSLEL